MNRFINKTFSSFSSSLKIYKRIYNFHLSKQFIDLFEGVKAPFGFNGLGELVYKRTYSRPKNDGKPEEWKDTIERVVNGTFTMQKHWIEQHHLGWNERKGIESAEEMYIRIFDMKFLPPGRGLWAMGSAITEKKHLHAALNNCAFVSTGEISRDDGDNDPSKPFIFTMDMTMLGVGVGYDTKGEHVIVRGCNSRRDGIILHTVEDSREGWLASVKVLINNWIQGGKPLVHFDYSKIRAKGTPIKVFGGVSNGSDSLKELHERLVHLFEKRTGKPLGITGIVDIMNYIACACIAGNVQRSAQIAFGDPLSDEFINLKDYNVNPYREEHGWTSNNSIYATLGMDYSKIAEKIVLNGEPGFAWLDNMRYYSRMKDVADYKDIRAMGGNPCLEQTLESYELCCLVETFPDRHDNLKDYLKTLKYAYLYAKTVTLGKTHWEETNRVLLRNRRIGCSMSGISQFLNNRGLHELKRWCTEGYKELRRLDKIYSDWYTVPRSIKMTCVKPSGTVSLLAGATPGIHYPLSSHYIRRIRVLATEKNKQTLIEPFRKAGYKIEDDNTYPPGEMAIIEIPVCINSNRTLKDVSMWEQLSLASFMQKYWADNQVSCTISFDTSVETAETIKNALNFFQYDLKGISFLPLTTSSSEEDTTTPYKQMPYENITKEQYEILIKNIKPIDWNVSSPGHHQEPEPELYCNNDTCVVVTALK